MNEMTQESVPVEDPFADLRGKRMGELTAEQTDRANELWLREQIGPWEERYWYPHLQALFRVIDRLRAQQAKPVQDQEVEDAIEAAYWQFDCRRSGINEWASAPQSERDAFKAEARKLVRGHFPTRQAQDTKREMLAVANAFIRGKRAALTQQAKPVQQGGWHDAAQWLRDNYQDHQTIAGLCDAMVAAAPVQRKPLTEDEIEALFEGVDSEDKGRFAIVRGFARAIEAAHGIKGGGNG